MSLPSNPIVAIPARLASTRLPDKPLADIHGRPMIVHVLERARAAGIGPVMVACADALIADAVRTAGGLAVLTDPALPTGSDRIDAALRQIDPHGDYDAVVNVQGDLPTIDPAIIRAALTPLANPDVDIATLVVEITREEERHNPNVVKAVVTLDETTGIGRALYFSRATVPPQPGPHFHHIGLYAYRRGALTRFVGLPQGVLEKRESLEQLRALEHGMRIAVARVETVPLGVDTPADLERARELLRGEHSRTADLL